ncbi:MAG: PEP-CTERM sorting domain-containing protein [Armatimonadota bacterium]
MIRPTGLLLCLLAVLLLSSAANATLVWANPITVWGPWGIWPTTSEEFDIPPYLPLLYGGAELQAVRFDLTTYVEPIEFGVLNPTSDSVYGMLTVAGGVQVYDPSAPATTIVETQHEWSQWMAVAPMAGSSGYVTDYPHAAVGIVTTDLERFVCSDYYSFPPVSIGVRSSDYSSWTGPDGVYLSRRLAGIENLWIYYGYDDGTPARTPEPGTLLLMAAGLPALSFLRRRRKTTSA